MLQIREHLRWARRHMAVNVRMFITLWWLLTAAIDPWLREASSYEGICSAPRWGQSRQAVSSPEAQIS
jgi:hypothetical protein